MSIREQQKKLLIHCSCAILTAGALCLLFSATAHAQMPEEPWEGAYTADPFAGGVIRQAYCDISGLVEGSLGALFATAAAVMAIASAAFGNLRQGAILLATAVGAATITTSVSLGFGDLCDDSGNATKGKSSRTMSIEQTAAANNTAVSAFTPDDISAMTSKMLNKNLPVGEELNSAPAEENEDSADNPFDSF